ncbi:MAG TPA: hypothetical protein VH988_22595 [Thermoanaerobaculia bacterium]|jgi:hypothetical protein|nr:hypothetical protein [Thermoanaerobaculia bacterium]
MSSIAVNIMLHGLIALVPMNDQSGMANHMTALLVDARTVPPEAQANPQCVSSHRPTLKITTSTRECQDAGCTVSGQDCTCDLSRQEISLTPDVITDVQSFADHPATSLPFEKNKAADFSYVANLAGPALGLTLNTHFRDDDVPPTKLVARMKFPFEMVSACALGTRRDEGGFNVHPMGFRRLGTLEKETDVNQAMAQQVMAMYEVDDGQPVTVTLKSFDNPAVIHSMVLGQGPNGYDVFLVNEREDVALDSPCDDGIGRDFAFFYDLATEQVAWPDRKVPHIKYTRWKGAGELDAPACQGGKTVNSRPMCPMGSFVAPPQT